jgi:regulator of sigma E protease
MVLGYIATFVLIIVVVVGVHEGGHFAVAKWSGIRVDEFSIGFGPRIWSRRRGETVYSLRALPLGGYVRMPGMSALEKEDAGERAFMRASNGKKMATILAGVVMNFLLAGVLFTAINVPGETSHFLKGAPLAEAGLRDGDVVLQVGAIRIDRDLDAAQRELHDATASSEGRPVEVRFRRAADGSIGVVTVRPYLYVQDANAPADGLVPALAVTSVDGEPVGTGSPRHVLKEGGPVRVTGHPLGDPATTVSGTLSDVGLLDDPSSTQRARAAWRLGLNPGFEGKSLPQAVVAGFGEVPRGIGLTVKVFYDAATSPSGGAIQNFQGPVGIAKDTAQATKAGWIELVRLIGGISLGLGIINLLPIPPFDGGRFAIIAGEAISRRRVDPRREMAFVVAGLMLILTFFVFITINDIRGF